MFDSANPYHGQVSDLSHPLNLASVVGVHYVAKDPLTAQQCDPVRVAGGDRSTERGPRWVLVPVLIWLASLPPAQTLAMPRRSGTRRCPQR